MITRFEHEVRGGWALNMHCVELGGGALLVYGATWLGDDTCERIAKLGTPSVIVVPNHYHHLSLARFREHYPDAVAVAHPDAHARLSRKGHDGLSSSIELPPHVSLLAGEGTKNGELWVEVDAPEDRSWLVGDAFFHMTRPLRGPAGWFLRFTKATPGLCIGDTFRWVGLREEARYRAWLLDRLAERPPSRVGFCHGEPFEGESVADELTSLAELRLRG